MYLYFEMAHKMNHTVDSKILNLVYITRYITYDDKLKNFAIIPVTRKKNNKSSSLIFFSRIKRIKLKDYYKIFPCFPIYVYICIYNNFFNC